MLEIYMLRLDSEKSTLQKVFDRVRRFFRVDKVVCEKENYS